jgi:hypothetical protein
MLKDVRRHAGLGDPPEPFYNNVPESANAFIKRGVNFKENEMSKFCQEMSVLVLRQKEDVESAIINHGPYRLAPKFSDLELSADQWFKKNSHQKEAYVRKFHNAKMSPRTVDSSSIQPSASVTSRQTQPVEISTDLTSVGITSASSTTLEHVSAKAKVLLNKVDAIIQAPTADGQAYMVESGTMAKPHYVSVAKNGKVTCTDCPGWSAFKICSHSLAVAEKTGRTADYVKWLRGKGPQRPNLTALITCDSGKGVGKKSRQSATARRKGGRSSNNAPPTTVVDRLPSRPTTTSASINPPSSNPAEVSSQSSLPGGSTNPQHVHGRFYQCTTGFYSVPNFDVQPPHHQPTSNNQQLQDLQPSNEVRPSMVYPIYSAMPFSRPLEGIYVQLLQLCSPLVRTCFGCSQSLKPHGAIAIEPYDLVLVTKMNREWPDKITGERRQSFQNVYFHINLRCIKMKQPYFSPRMVTTPDSVRAHLTPVHKHFLTEFGIII